MLASFPIRLSTLRISAGMSQRELAHCINTNRWTVTSWENGQSSPTCEKLVVLAAYFNVSADYLLGLSNEISHIF